jgi:lycopene beta-cyclase
LGQVEPVAQHLVAKPMSERYDFIIAGGGLAGRSLTYYLVQSNLPCSILMIDRDPKERNDRTFSFWANRPTLFDDLVCHSWSQLQFKSEYYDGTLDLRDYAYKMIRGIDFYRFTESALRRRGNVELLTGNVDSIEEEAEGVRVSVGGQVLRGRWAFDSRFHLSHFSPDPSRYHYLQQHFSGWVVETPHPAFDPQTATLFDFRTGQKDGFSFFYLLPFSEHQALIEYVSLNAENYERALETYVETVLSIEDYEILAREGGVNPLTDYAFPRRLGARRLAIGTLGGRVKPTSGYAFMRIQQDSAAIVRSLRDTGSPFHIPSGSNYYRLCDSLMLQLMHRRGADVVPLFADLFENNPVRRVLRFLDETASPAENLALMASLPPGPFLQAFVRLIGHQI